MIITTQGYIRLLMTQVQDHLDLVRAHTRTLVDTFSGDLSSHHRARDIVAMLNGVLDRVMQVENELTVSKEV